MKRRQPTCGEDERTEGKEKNALNGEERKNKGKRTEKVVRRETKEKASNERGACRRLIEYEFEHGQNAKVRLPIEPISHSERKFTRQNISKRTDAVARNTGVKGRKSVKAITAIE